MKTEAESDASISHGTPGAARCHQELEDFSPKPSERALPKP